MTKTIILVGIGGFLGSVSRYLTAYFFAKILPSSFPYGTLVANVLGCFLIGIVLGAARKWDGFSPEWSVFLATGFCGGFTTFSSFSYENMVLLQTAEYLKFTLYTLGSLALGLGAVFTGLSLTK